MLAQLPVRLAEQRGDLLPAARVEAALGLAPLGDGDGTGAGAADDVLVDGVERQDGDADDFDGPAGQALDRADWAYDVGGGGWGNAELQTYTDDPSNAVLDGEGNLAITARLVSGTPGRADQQWTSARAPIS